MLPGLRRGKDQFGERQTFVSGTAGDVPGERWISDHGQLRQLLRNGGCDALRFLRRQLFADEAEGVEGELARKVRAPPVWNRLQMSGERREMFSPDAGRSPPEEHRLCLARFTESRCLPLLERKGELQQCIGGFRRQLLRVQHAIGEPVENIAFDFLLDGPGLDLRNQELMKFISIDRIGLIGEQ